MRKIYERKGKCRVGEEKCWENIWMTDRKLGGNILERMKEKKKKKKKCGARERFICGVCCVVANVLDFNITGSEFNL